MSGSADSVPSTDALLERLIREAREEAYQRGVADTQAAFERKIRTMTGRLPILDTEVSDLGLTERPRNCLMRYWGIQRTRNPSLANRMLVSDLIRMTSADLLDITNFGSKALDEVIAKLAEHDLKLADM